MTKIFRRESKLYPHILGIFIILCIYFILYFKYDLTKVSTTFFSLSYPSDPAYLPLIFDFDRYLFSGLNHFPWILILPEFIISKIFGKDYIWITFILYKIFLFCILLYSICKIFKFNKINSYLFAIFLAIILTSSFMLFEDRFLRPQITNIFFFIVFFKIFEIIEFENKKSKKDFFYIGLIASLLATGSPWDFLNIFFLFLFLAFKQKNFILPFLVGFSLFIILNLLSIIRLKYFESYHLDYLGSKEIYNRLLFLKDFIINVFLAKKNLILIFFVFFSSIFLKKKYLILTLISCLIFSILPSIIFGKTLQSYHFIQSSFNICLLFSLACIGLIVSKYFNNKAILLDVSKLVVVVLFSIFILQKYSLENSYFKRIYKNNYLYSEIIGKTKNFDKECVIVSNDLLLRSYFIYNGYKVLPEDGFYQYKDINLVMTEYNRLINFLKKNHKLNKKDEYNFLNSIAHNYFATSRATAPNLLLNNLEDLNTNVKYIDSFAPWPKEIYNEVTQNFSKYFKFSSELNNINFNLSNYYLILNSGTLKNVIIKKKNLCNSN